ncbi:dephospho-CoA kinase [Neoconidiobolus thromboides FSU 785]|nr:dephospho-CoA kinase [Neoconidiobolus thromboides FSU 785]
MYILGLSGGIASEIGKSSISSYLLNKGYYIVDADKLAREAVLVGSYGYKKIVKEFHRPEEGDDILNPDLTLNRKKLGEIIFNNEKKRLKLNSILHPIIRFMMGWEILKCYLSGYSLIILDVPLLFESSIYKFTSGNVLIYCPVKIQLNRLMSRDNITLEEANKRIDSQMKLDDKIKLSNFIVDNSGDLEESFKQIDQLIKRINHSKFKTLLWLLIPSGAIAALSYSVYKWIF